MNFKALETLTLDAIEFEGMEGKLRAQADAASKSIDKLKINSRANFWGIEARKARGELAGLIFGYAHYKGAEKMAAQAKSWN